MRLIIFLLTASLMQASATGFAQQLTLTQKNVTLKEVFNEIRKQTGYNVVWPQESVRSSTRIDANFRRASLKTVLDACFAGKPLEYTIEDRTIVVREREDGLLQRFLNAMNAIDVRGRVVDEKGAPLAGASVVIDGRQRAVTGSDGTYLIKGVEPGTKMTVSYIGYKSKEVTASTSNLVVLLELSDSKLDEVQVMAYGTTSRRLGTGNIETVDGETIANTPVNNPLAALEGRLAGVLVSQDSGVPGSAVNVQIRGRTRVDPTFGAAESPLFIIDGVPIASGNENLNLLGSAISGSSISGLSPFSTISPGDIESIDVLKDADATAIYGSRGASGVVLITTKKGVAGEPVISARFGSGFSKANIPQMLNTKQYLEMRKEAFRNDGKTMTVANAPDVMLWDTTRTTNLAEELLGGTASFTNAEASVSGGSQQTQYVVRSTYARETNVYPTPMPNTRGTVYANLSTKALKDKLNLNFVGSYASSTNKNAGTDPSMKLILPPHFKLYNDDGSIAWNEGGVYVGGGIMDNPLAYLLETYTAKTGNLTGNLVLGYKILPELTVRTSLGYNKIRTDELRNSPKTAKNPMSANITNTSQFGNSIFESMIIEPQIEYKKAVGPGNLNVLAGGTLQSQTRDGYNFTLRDYSSDALLGTMFGINSSSFVNPNSLANEYKYAAIFGRATYNYDDTYILNLSGRRDGSSRFGPNYKYSSFWALGGAWIFSNLDVLKDSKVLSFGKLRASYGITGNDQIGDYRYMALYASNAFSPTYKDSLAISPESFFKPDLHWEMNKKLEFATELGFLKDRIIVSTAWYRNNSNDPLVQYPLPTATGFSTVTANLNNVVVQNRGWEFTLNSKNIKSADFNWNTNFNLTLPNNRLLKYPDLEQSSYASRYIVGRSLDLVYIGEYLGVDPTTGLSQVRDVNNSGKFEVTNTGDLTPRFDTEPAYYGGLQNDFQYKNFGFSVFLNFNKQWTRNWMMALDPRGTGAPMGDMYNVPENALKRWQYEGQITDVQKYTTIIPASNALVGQRAARSTDAIYNNVFYMRVRTVNLSYNLSPAFAKSIGLKSAGIYLQGQNLFTFSPFSSVDPQTVFISRLSPLRTYLAGLQVSL
ncbi:SusC/RagA family TonB-linked outer membrane protein [Pedobacter faecalis]|uniref:SusC/RagA family TonB-linked outer membrane protein n=1 Tax=Pedobacter faecalis TaxID=3041495 RepID=UPI00254FF693|nr:SusC/RagA family TonB-linked outer membrane protein [Pedobacter sp. ELA7]